MSKALTLEKIFAGLEELIGLAEGTGKRLDLAKEIYFGALEHVDELSGPYASVIDIDRSKLPSVETVKSWNSDQFVAALRRDQTNKDYNPHVRQLLHVGYKIAAKLGDRYIHALKECEESVSRNVTLNLYERHLKPLFVNGASASYRNS